MPVLYQPPNKIMFQTDEFLDSLKPVLRETLFILYNGDLNKWKLNKLVFQLSLIIVPFR